MSLESLSQINNLIDAANAKTGNADTTLTDAVQTLCDGFGQGGDEVLNAVIARTITEISSDTATQIGASAFKACASLVMADFPAVTYCAEEGFYKCSALTSVNIPLVEKIYNHCFGYCTALEKLDLPAVTYIDSYALYGASALSTLILRASTVATLRHTVCFTNTPIASGAGYIYVPSSLVDSYKAATNWSTYADQIRAIEDYPDITGG